MKALDEGFLRDTPRGQFNRKTRLPELEAERDVLLGIVRAERLVARANEASAQRRTRIAELEQLPTMMDNLQTRARNLGRAVSDGFTSGFQFISEEVDKALKPFRDRAESIFQITRTAGEMFAQDMEELKKLTGLGLIDRDTVKRATKMYQEELDRPMADRAARILEQTRTPLERIKKEIEDVMELFREGFINESAMGRAMAMFKDQLKSTFEQSPIRVQATLPGLSDSRFLTGATQQSQEKLLARQTMNLQKRQTDEAVKANGLLQQIREALTSGEPLILGAELGR